MSATLLPILRDETVTMLRDLETTPDAPYPGLATRIHDGDLLWVAPAMSQLVAAARQDLPETDTLPQVGSGLVYWGGGTDISMRDSTTGRTCQISGAIYSYTGTSRPFTLPLTDDLPDTAPTVRRGYQSTMCAALVSAPETDDEAAAHEQATRQLIDHIRVTHALAEMPTIARQGRMRLPGPPVPGRPETPRHITTITLREGVHDPTGARQEHEDSGRRLTTRHLVRGHWRWQACGPNHAEQRLLYVPPFIRGPEGAPLVTKPVVKIWRR